jgi:hypothetical protein
MTVVLPLGASPKATLEVVRQLLHNPPGSHASPSATEQWRHDVDQLIVNAINTLPHGGVQVNRLHRMLEPSVAHSRSPATHSHPPSAPRMSSMLVASLATVDLRAELEHQHSGEDGRITIERQWERHGYQGRNLNGDFDAVDTTPMRQAARPPTPPTGSGVVARHLPHTATWWPGRTSSGPTCRRSTKGVSTPSSSCRSTPHRSSVQEEMRPSWPTISRWP